MKPALVSLLILAFFATESEACRRCGLFGRRCRFVSSSRKVVAVNKVQKVAVAEQPQTVILQNNYPLAVQGSTGYSFSSNFDYQAINPSLHLSQAARLVERGQDLAAQALTEYTASLESTVQSQSKVAEILATGQAATTALQAAAGVQTSRQASSTTVTLKIQGGKVTVVENQDRPRGGVGPALQSTVGGAFGVCLRCHSGADAKNGFRLDQTLSLEKFVRAKKKVLAGQMPPKNPLSVAQMAQFDQEFFNKMEAQQ